MADQTTHSAPKASPSYILRPAAPADIPALADIIVEASIQDDPFDVHLYPRRFQYQKRYRDIYLDGMRHRSREQDMLIVLAENPESAEVVGFATWTRNGKSKKVVRRVCERMRKELKIEREQLEWTQKIYHHIASLDTFDLFQTILNPAASTSRAWHFPETNKDIWLDPAFVEPVEHWYLCELAVLPRCQRRGIGAQLVQWGQDRARSEDPPVPLVLHSTPAGRRTYEKTGFELVGWWRWGKGEEQISATMLWDPKRVGERAGVVAEK